jgi:hypothetical protein
MGHEVVDWDGPTVLLQSVDWDRRTNEMHAGADPRNAVGAGKVEYTKVAGGK